MFVNLGAGIKEQFCYVSIAQVWAGSVQNGEAEFQALILDNIKKRLFSAV